METALGDTTLVDNALEETALLGAHWWKSINGNNIGGNRVNGNRNSENRVRRILSEYTS